MKKTPAPPRWADRLLEWRLSDGMLEEVQGDLHERFHRGEKVWGEKEARKQYVRDVVGYLLPRRGIPFFNAYTKSNSLLMFRNYLTIAIRNLWRNKAFSAINIFGLAIGLTTCLLIVLFVLDELSYDRHFPKADQIYRMGFSGKLNGQVLDDVQAGAPVAQAMHNDYPEVLAATRMRLWGEPFIRYGDRTFKERAFIYVDSNFFQVFEVPFLKGDPRTALLHPYSIVITQEAARKYFGDADPMGQVLEFKDWGGTYKVTGLIASIPANTHFHYELFAAMSGLADAKDPIWLSSNYYTYLVLPKGYNYRQLEAKFPQVVEKYMGPQVQQFLGVDLNKFRQAGNEVGLFLQPLTDIHLHSHLGNEVEPNGDIRYVYIFSVIALFMLMIACINFMNLSTASAANRAKEVGIRKVLGSVKSQLVRQFLTESVLLTLIALIVALGLIKLALPVFNALAVKQLQVGFFNNVMTLPILLLICLIVGLLAGSYPAFILSAYKPVAVLKGRLTGTARGVLLRKGLVVFQFFISTTLIIGTVVVYRQLGYMQQKKVGFDKEQVLVIQDTYTLNKQEQTFRNTLLQQPGVISASVSGYVPVGETNGNNSAVLPEDNPNQIITMQQYRVDEAYIPTLGMEMAQGRNFSRDFPTDSSAMIINEAAARALGWEKNAIGRKITRFGATPTDRITYVVIGVVKDFHFRSLHEKISPLLMLRGENSGNILVKVKTEDVAGLLASVQQQWNRFSPIAPFTYSFLDERFSATYQAEKRIGRIMGIFAGLTIFIACLGLFGLATFTTRQRTKEIGIRKVLGASVSGIATMLSKDFLQLVLVANVIAWPLAWWAMNRWLQDFAYRIEMSWWVFGLAGVLALLIALLTVSYQAIKAALANPVKSLRTE
jgi:putative ABC transport system permease protein